jgi:hypothetical protein
MMNRLKNSETPDLIEFNTVCKDRPRLKIFRQITSKKSSKGANLVSKKA